MRYADTFALWSSTTRAQSARAWLRARALDAFYARMKRGGELDAALKRPRVQFLCFHHLFRDEEEPFRRMMDRLAQQHTFISWSRGVDMVLSGETPDRPYVCFSSDDGYESNKAFTRILGEFDATACLFLNPSTIGETDDHRATTFARVRLECNPVRFLSWTEVEDMMAAGHEIGNHTMTHVVCSETPSPRLEDEILATKNVLEARLGPVQHFAWPYGQFAHFSEAARRFVFETGHRSAAGVVRGCHLGTESHPDPSVVSIRRDQVWAVQPLRHLLYFMARNAVDPTRHEDGFGALVEGHSEGAPKIGLSQWDAIAWPDAIRTSGPDASASHPGAVHPDRGASSAPHRPGQSIRTRHES